MSAPLTPENERVWDEKLAELLHRSGMTLSLAESCSGGLIAKRITDIPGSSAYFGEGVITYSNGAKKRLLGVPQAVLDSHGAVSAECAEAMAAGIRAASGSDIGVAVTGIAGPDGGSGEKPVGTVYIALASAEGCRAERYSFPGGRDAVRARTAQAALEWLQQHLLTHERHQGGDGA